MPNNIPYCPSLAGWRTIDKIQVCLLAVLIPIMMVISAVNLQSLIENSYQPVFINALWKSWAISLLAPCASICIERLPEAFTHDQTKLLVKKIIQLLTAFVIVAWILLFSMTFDGFSTPNIGDFLSIDAVETGTQDTRLYSFTQLMVEILISACLFMRLESLLAHHQPVKKEPNPQWQTLDEKIRHRKIERESIVKHLERETERHTQLVNARQAFINNWLDELAIAKARHAAISNFFGDEK